MNESFKTIFIMFGVLVPIVFMLWRLYADNKNLWDPKPKNDDQQQTDEKES